MIQLYPYIVPENRKTRTSELPNQRTSELPKQTEQKVKVLKC